MKFEFQARTITGEIKSGIVEASTREAALSALKEKEFYVTALQEHAPPIYAIKLNIFERVSKKDIAIFSRQLAIMFKSRIPLVETLRTLSQQMNNAFFQENILKIAEDVEGGTSLSKALAVHPKIFSSFYVSMVSSGEASGKLTDVFLYLADYLEKEHHLKSKLIGAFIYPSFILAVFIGVVALIVGYVIPQLSTILKETGQELPLITRIVISVSDFTRTKGWVLVIVFAILALIIYQILKMPKGKSFFDKNILRVPFVGDFMRKFYITRVALNLSTLISGGLPITQALQITSEVVGNDKYRDIMLEAKEDVRKGDPVSSILKRYPQFISPLFYQMVVVGEKTGTIDTSLINVVSFYQGEVNRALDDFIKLLEPILIVVLGLVVGGLMASVLLPIYTTGLG